MTVRLIEDRDALAHDESAAGRYVAALVRDGVGHYIANANSRALLLSLGDRSLPVTVDEGGYGRSYVASPHSEIDDIAANRRAYFAVVQVPLRLLQCRSRLTNGFVTFAAAPEIGVLCRKTRTRRIERRLSDF